MKIKEIKVRQILDSRGEETLEVELETQKGVKALAQVPQGKSKSSKEVVYLPFEKVKENLKLLEELYKRSIDSIQELDSILIEKDSTSNKSNLGGNLTLGISIAGAKALAKEREIELWELLKAEFFSGEEGSREILIFANLINGGKHAQNNLSFQEYMVVAKVDFENSTEGAVFGLRDFYFALREELLKKFQVKNLYIGDEGGFSLDFPRNLDPLEVLSELIAKRRESFNLALDIAANSFYQNGYYLIDNQAFSQDELLDYYLEMISNFSLLISIEDPFAENQLEAFKMLKARLKDKVLIIGDDLTSTNPKIIDALGKEKSIDGVVIKANQIGTLTESCLAIKEAQTHSLKYIISHRSGETEDNFLIHLAKASSAFGVKIGAPVRERALKYNELLRLSHN